jgi:beta-glucosidase
VDAIDPAKQAELNAEALQKAQGSDLIIFVGGLNKNHRQDCENGDRESYDLSYGQNELISQLAKIQKNIIVVMFGGNPYSMPWLNQVSALTHCWYLGSESGTALANVLSGKVCPSGKLPITFAEKYEDYPYVKYGPEAYPGVNKQVHYKEDIFVGYRHFATNNVTPRFPFGFGLSYTTFSCSKPVAAKSGNEVTITVTVSNTGAVAGKEVVQVYAQSPKGELPRPIKELKGFAKTKLLQPGESQTLSITIPVEELRNFNDSQHDWTLISGDYTFHVGTSVNDIFGKATVNL